MASHEPQLTLSSGGRTRPYDDWVTSHLSEARSPELEANPTTSAPPRLLIVPLGSTEQHGPHLPLSTDTIIAEAWAAALARSLEASGATNVMVAPALPYGAAGEHQSFAGTLSIGTEATITVIVELARSAAHFADRLVFLSGHAGNVDALRSAVDQLRHEGHDVHVVLPVLAGSDAHAGRTETSLMLHIAPSLVAIERAEAGNSRPIAELLPELRAGGVVAVSANGILGNPAGASADEGKQLMDRLVDHARQAIDR